MIDTPQPTTREQQAMAELGHTMVSPRTAWALLIAFLAGICGVVIVECIGAISDADARLLPPGWRLDEIEPSGALGLSWAPTANDLKDFEARVEDQSLLRAWLLGPTQAVLTGVLGLGNEEAIAGNDGWLYYASDVEYVTGPSFLDPLVFHLHHRMRAGGVDARWADPRVAIIEFRDQLASRGIDLVLLPIAVKPQVHGSHLDPALASHDAVLQNPGWATFKASMQAADVHVFDPSDLLLPTETTGDTYLTTDTHWTPEAMDVVARALAAYLRDEHAIDAANEDIKTGATEIINAQGDLVTMLHLPDPAAFYPALRVHTTSVLHNNTPWTPTRNSHVLLLGDSFSNIYELESMGFGAHAGLAAHLSLALQAPIDAMTRNAGGAAATRQALADELARHQAQVNRGQAPAVRERLADTRVVVWQFAMRELSFGNWRPVTLPTADPTHFGQNTSDAIDDASMSIKGTVVQMTHAPDPASVPYKDAVIALHLRNVSGLTDGTELMVFGMGMSDRVRTTLDAINVGDVVHLNLQPWALVESMYGGLNRIELDDPDFSLIALPLYWGAPAP
jgi:alginate O-acetyltransferase complex protein AlgJ